MTKLRIHIPKEQTHLLIVVSFPEGVIKEEDMLVMVDKVKYNDYDV